MAQGDSMQDRLASLNLETAWEDALSRTSMELPQKIGEYWFEAKWFDNDGATERGDLEKITHFMRGIFHQHNPRKKLTAINAAVRVVGDDDTMAVMASDEAFRLVIDNCVDEFAQRGGLDAGQWTGLLNDLLVGAVLEPSDEWRVRACTLTQIEIQSVRGMMAGFALGQITTAAAITTS